MKKTSKFVPQTGTGEKGEIVSIILASQQGDVGIVKRLLETGIDINTTDEETGFTPLHIAAVHGDRDLLDVLLEHHNAHGGLDFNLLAKVPQRTAWQLAMSHGQFDVGERIDIEAHKAKRSSKARPPSP